MDLSIIIVNWNSADYVQRCISTIFDETVNIDFEIIVVDNASFDNCKHILESNFTNVHFIQSQNNIGFANANNLGFAHSSGNVILFLNPDTEIIGSAINIAYSSLLSLPDAGAVGCKLLNSDMTLQTSSTRAFPTLLNEALDSKLLRRLFPKSRLWGIRPLYFHSDKPQKVDGISGAFMMVKRDVFEQVGLFTENYFMYSEDVDLCYKINKLNYKVYYDGTAEIIHHGGGSTRNRKLNLFSAVLMRESRFTFFKTTKGKTIAEFYKLLILFCSIFRLLLLFTLLPFSRRFECLGNVTNSIRKWRKVLQWSLGFEDWARQLGINAK